MTKLTSEGQAAVKGAAERQGFSLDAGLALLEALVRGGGSQAQFNHPEFGGMGQWSQGGMIMIGDMFNQGLKSRVDSLCGELAGLLRNGIVDPAAGSPSEAPGSRSGASSQLQAKGGGAGLFAGGSSSSWWPAGLGSPASSGAQNDLRYAFFPAARRLAIQQNGATRLYDTGDHDISGYSQQQSSDQTLTFTSQYGPVRLDALRRIEAGAQDGGQTAPVAAPPPPPASDAPRPDTQPGASPPTHDVLHTIERLAELRRKDIITDQEFAAKKAELLGRL